MSEFIIVHKPESIKLVNKSTYDLTEFLFLRFNTSSTDPIEEWCHKDDFNRFQQSISDKKM